jgi:hypothetical protein
LKCSQYKGCDSKIFGKIQYCDDNGFVVVIILPIFEYFLNPASARSIL